MHQWVAEFLIPTWSYHSPMRTTSKNRNNRAYKSMKSIKCKKIFNKASSYLPTSVFYVFAVDDFSAHGRLWPWWNRRLTISSRCWCNDMAVKCCKQAHNSRELFTKILGCTLLWIKALDTRTPKVQFIFRRSAGGQTVKRRRKYWHPFANTNNFQGVQHAVLPLAA